MLGAADGFTCGSVITTRHQRRGRTLMPAYKCNEEGSGAHTSLPSVTEGKYIHLSDWGCLSWSLKGALRRWRCSGRQAYVTYFYSQAHVVRMAPLKSLVTIWRIITYYLLLNYYFLYFFFIYIFLNTRFVREITHLSKWRVTAVHFKRSLVITNPFLSLCDN